MRGFNKRGLKCEVCGRTFNEHSSDSCCPECFEIAGYDNEVNDYGAEAQTAATNVFLGTQLKAIAAKGGDIEAVKASNEYIDWSQVTVTASRTHKGGDTRATNGVKAPVVVNDKQYRSVREAFVALGLPLSKHQKFRKELKLAGNKAFECDGHLYMFTAAGF
jgi:hypothetical protein